MKLPKLGLVRFAKSREVDGRVLSATIRRNPSGKYFLSVFVETDVQSLEKTGSSVGIDVGLKDFAILSDGIVYKNPKYVRQMEAKLAKAQRVLSRRQEVAIKQKRKISEAKNKRSEKRAKAKA